MFAIRVLSTWVDKVESTKLKFSTHPLIPEFGGDFSGALARTRVGNSGDSRLAGRIHPESIAFRAAASRISGVTDSVGAIVAA
jgi:hypothetical protein